MHQQHATVQMSAIAGVPPYVSQELPNEENVYEAKVRQAPIWLSGCQALAGSLVPSGGSIAHRPLLFVSWHQREGMAPDRQVMTSWIAVTWQWHLCILPASVSAQLPCHRDGRSQVLFLPQGILHAGGWQCNG